MIPEVKALAKVATEQCQDKSYLIVVCDPETEDNYVIHNFDTPMKLFKKLMEMAADLPMAGAEWDKMRLRDTDELLIDEILGSE